MNTPHDPAPDELRHAEYALGVLDADARAAVEREMADDSQSARAVAAWQAHLTPLADDVAPVDPPPYVWARIQSALGFDTARPTAAPASRASWWDNLRLWRWVGIGASLAVAALVVVTVVQLRTTPGTQVAGYMVANIEQPNGVAGWTATMDLQQHRMVVVPATPEALASGRDAELWLIPPGEKPISLGVIARDKATSIDLPPAMLARLSAKAALAVTVEPLGGSPSGDPTGPVMAKGAISGV